MPGSPSWTPIAAASQEKGTDKWTQCRVFEVVMKSARILDLALSYTIPGIFLNGTSIVFAPLLIPQVVLRASVFYRQIAINPRTALSNTVARIHITNEHLKCGWFELKCVLTIKYKHII